MSAQAAPLLTDDFDAAATADMLKALANQDEKGVLTALEAGANPNATDPHGNPAIFIATRYTLRQAADALLGCGADPRVGNLQGRRATDICRDHALRRRLWAAMKSYAAPSDSRPAAAVRRQPGRRLGM